jgi:hypothetical protein
MWRAAADAHARAERYHVACTFGSARAPRHLAPDGPSPDENARMRLTLRQLNRATLARQMLLQRESMAVPDGVRRIVAIQAQEPASPYVALWNRLVAFDPAHLDDAFASQGVIKATLMRMTLHAVVAADYPVFHDAMQPTLRASRLGETRSGGLGLSPDEADRLVPEILAFASRPRTNAEVEAWLDERLGVLPRPGAWWAVRTYAPFVHAPTGATWSFGPRPAYVAAPTRPREGDPDASMRWLARRFLEGFGPASVQDLSQFALVPRSRARDALQGMGDELDRLTGPGGEELYDVPGGQLPPGDAPAPPRLMAMWDSTLLAYADRSRIIPHEYRRLVIRQNGDVLPALLVDGYVAGVWRPVEGGIEATAFHPLAEDAWAGLEGEAAALVAFLAERDPLAYRRYGRWWKVMTGADVRLLGVS